MTLEDIKQELTTIDTPDDVNYIHLCLMVLLIEELKGMKQSLYSLDKIKLLQLK